MNVRTATALAATAGALAAVFGAHVGVTAAERGWGPVGRVAAVAVVVGAAVMTWRTRPRAGRLRWRRGTVPAGSLTIGHVGSTVTVRPATSGEPITGVLHDVAHQRALGTMLLIHRYGAGDSWGFLRLPAEWPVTIHPRKVTTRVTP